MDRANERGHYIRYVWIPSRVGVSMHDHADRLAKSRCDEESLDIDLRIPLLGFHIVKPPSKRI